MPKIFRADPMYELSWNFQITPEMALIFENFWSKQIGGD